MSWPEPPPWTVFQWGSRGLYHSTGEEGAYVAHIFVPACVQAMLQADGPSGQEYLHIFHFRAPNASPDYSDCLAVAQVVNAWWGASYRNMVAPNVVGRRTVATALDAMPSAQATVYTAQPGTRSGTMAPSEISCALAFFTHLNGRRNHGGVRAWPPVVSDVVGDFFTPLYLGAIVGVFQNLINAANTAGYPMVVLSRADVAMKTIAGVINIDNVIDSQRRRTVNRGR